MTLGSRLPYPGLRAFTREESDLFFGRENCVDSMVDRLAATRFLAVLGPSGSGKSSLVRTGLMDALELGLHPTGSRWQVADLHPGRQPLRNLAAALLEAKGASPEPADVDLMAIFLARGPRSVAEWAAGGNLKEGANLLILVDQFEELFRYGGYAQREEAEAFVALLLESAAALRASIHIVITMRSEYLGACTLVPSLAERVNAGLYLTPRMSREECRAAIEGPARVIGFEVAQALVTRLLNDLARFAPWESGQTATQLERLARRADQLPLMQHVLNRLWTRAMHYADGREVRLELSAYEEVGGLSGALDAHGAEILAELDAGPAQHVETLFRALVSGPSVALAVRRPCRLAELLELIGSANDVVALVEAFRAPDCNFLRTSESSLAGDTVIVDISHESLIRQWTPLTRWLEKEVRDANEWRRLVAAQERYVQGEGGLLTGLDLQSLKAWWDSAHPNAAWAARQGGNFENVQGFLEASRRAEAARAADLHRQEMRERKRLRLFVAGLAAALVIAIALGLFAWKETVDARKNARDTSALLEQISTVLYSDRYVSLLGVDALQNELIGRLIRFQDKIDGQRSVAVNTASLVHRYRLARASSSLGDARTAMSNYAAVYNRGLAALAAAPAGKKLPDSFIATLIKAGVNYSWSLFDTNRDKEARDVMGRLVRLAGQYKATSASESLSLAYSDLENLQSRYEHEHKRGTNANQHIFKAIRMLQPVAARPDAPMEVLHQQVTMLDNVKGDERDRFRDEICSLADRMVEKNPMDKRAFRARLECLRGLAQRAYGKSDLAAAKAHYRDALGMIGNLLSLAPADQDLLLDMTEVETDIAGLDSAPVMEGERNQLNKQAGEHLIKALKGRTLLQNYGGQIKSLYNYIQNRNFSSQAEEFAFYRGIVEAVEPTLATFPNAHDFAYVVADAADHVGALLLKDPGRHREAREYLSKATNFFDKSGVIADPSAFSEQFAAYCGAYSHLLEVYAQRGLIEPMLKNFGIMKSACLPLINKYPFDIYLRNDVVKGYWMVGNGLFELQRYAEALPYLEYASHWTYKESSTLLARVYREGLGVPRDDEKARSFEALAHKQGMKRFTIPADFGGIKEPFYFYVTEWPTDYPFQGIDDQVKWLQIARGGKIPPEAAEAFRKLHKIARDNNVSFPELCAYALGTADQRKPGAH